MHENFNIFPFDKVEKGSKIILYGARTIGTEYLRQLQLLHSNGRMKHYDTG